MRHSPWLLKRIPSFLAFPERAARTPPYVASSPGLDGHSGRFFRQCRETHTEQITYNKGVAVRLWDMSQALYESRAAPAPKGGHGFLYIVCVTHLIFQKNNKASPTAALHWRLNPCREGLNALR